MQLSACLGALLSFLDGTSRLPQVPVPGRNPVLLVHGIADDARGMERMATYLRANGWVVHTLTLTPNWGQKGIKPLAEQVAEFAEQKFGKRRFDLVGYSMGGLVTRYYMQRLGGLKKVDRFVTLSTPHNGTQMAHLLGTTACREMRPGSDFLADLARDADKLRRVKFTSLYTTWDIVIVPARSSEMPQARNVKVKVGSHPGMIMRMTSLKAVADVLKS